MPNWKSLISRIAGRRRRDRWEWVVEDPIPLEPTGPIFSREALLMVPPPDEREWLGWDPPPMPSQRLPNRLPLTGIANPNTEEAQPLAPLEGLAHHLRRQAMLQMMNPQQQVAYLSAERALLLGWGPMTTPSTEE